MMIVRYKVSSTDTRTAIVTSDLGSGHYNLCVLMDGPADDGWVSGSMERQGLCVWVGDVAMGTSVGTWSIL